MMDVNQIYCGNHVTYICVWPIYTYRSNHYAVHPNIYSAVCQYISIKLGENVFNLTTHQKYAKFKNNKIPSYPSTLQKRIRNVDVEQK